MKTRFSSLVTLKKNTINKSEQVVQKANANLNSATMALSLSYDLLGNIDAPESGKMSDFLANRTLLSSQRGLIEHNKEWVKFSKNQAMQAKEQLKLDMIEHEKFKYLELEEIKKVLKRRKLEESKALDEVALMTHGRNNN